MARRSPAQYDWRRLLFDETWLTKHYTPSSHTKRYVVVHHSTIIGNGGACRSAYRLHDILE